MGSEKKLRFRFRGKRILRSEYFFFRSGADAKSFGENAVLGGEKVDWRRGGFEVLEREMTGRTDVAQLESCNWR